MTRKALCGIPVEVDTNAPADKIVVHPELMRRIEERVLYDAGSFRSLKSLYHAIIDMSESGIGYSPKTSDAIKKLKEIPSLQP